jgi:CHAT domain-containing protein/Tfp pilus assembly protein PilF
MAHQLQSAAICFGPSILSGRGLILFALVMLLMWSAVATVEAGGTHPDSVFIAAAQDAPDLPALDRGQSIERELQGAAAHSYRLVLTQDQYVSAVVDQRGIDVVVTLYAPDGEKLIEVDSPNGTQGPEPVTFISKSAGHYKLEVRSLDKEAKAGQYAVKLVELRNATEQDRSRQAGQTAYAEAEQFAAKGTADSLRKAIEKYQQSLPHWVAAGDRAGQANALSGIGGAYKNLGERQKALDYYGQALKLQQAIGDTRGEAQMVNNIAALFDAMGQKPKALENFEAALRLWRAAGDRSGEAATLSNMGSLYSSIGEPQKALELYNQALPLRRSVGDKPGEAATLNNMGAAYFSVGEPVNALKYFNQALALVKAIGDRRGAAYTLTSMGLVHDSLGEKQLALDHYDQALSLLKVLGDRYGTAATLNNVALLYDSLGERQKALDYYNESLSLVKALSDRYGQATVLNGLGKVYLGRGEAQKALESFNESLPLRRAIGDRAGEAYTLHNLGGVYEKLGDNQKAADHYEKALALWRVVGDRRGEANTLTSSGRISAAGSEPQKALEFFNQALTLHRTVRNRSGEALTLYELARFERDRGNLSEARSQILAAIDIIESLRTKIAGEQLRASYFASVQSYYELYIDLLMRLNKMYPSEGHDAAALQASERARARSLLDLLLESQADIRQGVDPQLLERERALQQRMNAKAERQLRLLSGRHTEEQAQAAAREIETLTTEYQEIEAKIRAGSPRYAALTQPQPSTLSELQKDMLDSDTLLLEYSLGEERSYLWAVSKTGIASYQLAKRSEIEEAARRFYEQLTASRVRASGKPQNRGLRLEQAEASYKGAADHLSKLVLPLTSQQLKNRRLVIVADGALQYVPFAALPSPSFKSNRPLIIDHEIVNLPSASTLAVLRRESAGRQNAAKSIAVLADPVFDREDERIKNRDPNSSVSSPRTEPSSIRGLGLAIESAQESGLTDNALRIPRLPGTRREAQAILALARGRDTKQALDFEASRSTAMSPDLNQYRYVHFATHGLLNSVHPELSGIVLSMTDERGTPQDGFLRAHEVFNLRLGAELVVLSACQTGLGKDVRGEGLVGLTRGFMYAGSPRVIVSLWNVSDAATAELMGRFYTDMLVNKLRPAAALRSAQVAMWKQKRWAAPFYWAAFTLQGEWR